MIEALTTGGEFEQKPNREVEKKYLPIFPEKLDEIRLLVRPIEQYYLSHPTEDFSLRFRETISDDGNPRHEATLKDRGKLMTEGLDRLEVVTEVSPEVYEYYKSAETPVIRKLRAELNSYVVVDYFEDGHIHAEAEHPSAWTAFCDQHRLNNQFVDVTGDKVTDNEWRAHLQYRREHGGKETLVPQEQLSPENIARDIWRHHMHTPFTVATVAGRSGSGKSTVIRDVQEQLEQNGIQSVVLSTDNYHRGKRWLESYKGGPWTDWDAPIVYDVDGLIDDITRLQNGEMIQKRQFDFETEEPTYGNVVKPAPVILIEGIYARHANLAALAALRFELTTPLATCIGRRLLRDLHERPQFADAAKSLRYMLESAEPAYNSQTNNL